MPDALPIPDDLVQLQRNRIAAENTLAGYVAEVDQRRREQYPAPEQLLERARWNPEESDELARLRAARDAAALTVRQHPTLRQALAEGCWPQTWDALQSAARES